MPRTKTCAVCLCSRQWSLFSSDYCCSSVRDHTEREICDSCVHQHVLSELDSCLTNDVSCPERRCRSSFTPSVVCDLLLLSRSEHLVDESLRERQWQGKSEEWIDRFSKPCPTCQLPIEKNGGCDEIACPRCQRHFFWSRTEQVDVPNSSFPSRILLLVALVFFTVLFFQ